MPHAVTAQFLCPFTVGGMPGAKHTLYFISLSLSLSLSLSFICVTFMPTYSYLIHPFLLRSSNRHTMHLLSPVIHASPSLSIKGGEPTSISQIPKQLKTLAPPLIAALVAFSPLAKSPGCLAQTAVIERGGALFRQACIGCHDGGGNIIQPGATLFTSDLERNGADTEEEIYRLTYYGKGRMPGFGEQCKPRGQCTFGPRLQEEDIRLLAKFVKSQADGGWSNP